MQITSSFVALALAGTAYGHSWMSNVYVNGADQGDGRKTYIRSPPNNSPVKDLTKADIVCNVNGATEVGKFVTAAAGDKITFEWFHDNRGDDIIAASHMGPIITYIAPYTSGSGQGAIWTKIAEDGYDSSWAVQKLINNKGMWDFTLPSQLAAGQYLVRQEIIAHHESDARFDQNPARGAQFYPSCVQFEVTGSGTVTPSQNFDFNTGYTYDDPGIHFNMYNFNPASEKYSIPGPDVFEFGGGGGGGGSPTTKAATTTKATTTSAPPTTTPKTTSLGATKPAGTTLSTSTTRGAAQPTTTRPTCPGLAARRRRRAAERAANRAENAERDVA